METNKNLNSLERIQIERNEVMAENNISFEILMNSIKEINTRAGGMAKSSVNQLMTLRNWAIGYYIVEYEQDGSDRAEYGTNLLKNLEK